MNIFTKAKIKSLLDSKINTGEIKFYNVSENTLHIKKSKRSKLSLDISGLSDDILIRILTKKIPDSGIMNISDFYKKELRNLKIQKIVGK
jgi:hypothetical protein